jgi:hypothetical protein
MESVAQSDRRAECRISRRLYDLMDRHYDGPVDLFDELPEPVLPRGNPAEDEVLMLNVDQIDVIHLGPESGWLNDVGDLGVPPQLLRQRARIVGDSAGFPLRRNDSDPHR